MLKLLYFVLFLISASYSAVLGIDFGNNFIKGAIISHGKPIVILENSATLRKTHNSLFFGKDKRVFEQSAYMNKSRFPSKTFNFFKKFLGATSMQGEIIKISKEYFEDFLLEFDQERDTVQFKLNLEKGEVVLAIEQITAMVIRYIKKLAIKQIGKEINEVVVTVPQFWSISARQSIDSACQIAGLKLVAITTENVAASLNHLINNVKTNINETSVGIIYNVGGDQATATLIKIGAINNTAKRNSTIDVLTILSEDSLQNVGGNSATLALTNYFAKQFDEQHRQGKSSILQNQKAKQKLFFECDKVKEVLSANKETTINVEQLMDDIDFHSKITRENFEQIIKPQLDQILIPLENVLTNANLKKTDLEFVELIGGGARVPIIQSILQNYFGQDEKMKLGSHLNLYESPAIGAAYLAANFSSHYRLKPMWLNDGFEHEFQMTLKTLDDGEIQLEKDQKPYFKTITLFPVKKHYKSHRSLQFSHNNNVQIDINIKYRNGTMSPYCTYNLTNITGLRTWPDKEHLHKPKIHIRFDLDSIKAVQLTEAEIWVNQTVFKNITRVISNYYYYNRNHTSATANQPDQVIRRGRQGKRWGAQITSRQHQVRKNSNFKGRGKGTTQIRNDHQVKDSHKLYSPPISGNVFYGVASKSDTSLKYDIEIGPT